MVKLGKPIVNIETDNSNSEARRLKPDALYGLKNSLFLATWEKVATEMNIYPKNFFPMDLLE